MNLDNNNCLIDNQDEINSDSDSDTNTINTNSISNIQDEILVYNTEEELLDILAMYQIDVKIMGEEYRDKDFTGRDLCKQRDIDFYFNKRDHRFSTSNLRKRVEENTLQAE